MSKTAPPTSKPVGTNALEATTDRTVIADAATTNLGYTDWPVFQTIAEATEDTIDRLRE